MAGFLSVVVCNLFGMKGRRCLVKSKFKIISEKKVSCWEAFYRTEEIDEKLTDGDDDIVSDNESESDK